ncbi:MAG TPA: family 1 glycosylhydrolase [Acidimicrobiales bacterium]|nr:family 1 glycosylhydrolase [Acidimicrobiales bacterium]
MLSGVPGSDAPVATGPLPPGFRFGVATAGFQIEGGFNGPGEPANNWLRWERAGHVEPSGIAIDFWNRYEDLLDRAASTGCDAFRMSVEWARVEPSEGEIDHSALDRYAAVLDACHERGLRPLVTLLHFTHPSWLGEDFWLSPESPERFAAWVDLAVRRLASRCRHWVTLNEINVVGLGSYLLGLFPPGRRFAASDMWRALDHLIVAHVRGYEVLHLVQPDAVVTTNNASISLYELDRLVIDVLVSRRDGATRDDIASWLGERRRRWYARLPSPAPAERALRRLSEALFTRAGADGGAIALPRAVEAVWSSPHDRTLDVVGIDYYDPLTANHVRRPGRVTAGGRSWTPAGDLWEDVVAPDVLATYLGANREPGLDLWVVENGLCNRVRRGRSFPRLDGWDRVRYLERNLAAIVAALDSGLPVGAYFHWPLADNYEWGSYEPRFGIFGVDRDRGTRVLDTDAMGFDAAGTYRRVVAGLRAGDRSVVGG